MQIGKLDHVNVRTANLDNMVAWYGEMLGMNPGKRPNFPFPGEIGRASCRERV